MLIQIWKKTNMINHVEWRKDNQKVVKLGLSIS